MLDIQDQHRADFINSQIDKMDAERERRRDAFASCWERDIRAADYLMRKQVEMSAASNIRLAEWAIGIVLVFGGAWAVGAASVF